jgi:hypothetical protein
MALTDAEKARLVEAALTGERICAVCFKSLDPPASYVLVDIALCGGDREEATITARLCSFACLESANASKWDGFFQ